VVTLATFVGNEKMVVISTSFLPDLVVITLILCGFIGFYRQQNNLVGKIINHP
jgi:hypothetical protein